MPNDQQRQPVTDAALLDQLNAREPVTDSNLLRMLEGDAPTPAAPAEDVPGPSNAVRFTMMPLEFDPDDDLGNEAGIVNALRNGARFGLPGMIASYAHARGISLAVPGAVETAASVVGDVLKSIGALPETIRRSMADEYPDTAEGHAQRSRDAIEISTLMMGVPPGAGAAMARVIPRTAGATGQKAIAASSPAVRG
ncbi:hypothetical protein [Hyphomicrobium sp. D-2]|uniref:hypothetical protein n=1 Tax=Hyphomicrobium sp. D-2 TaxID=3041621 RepID=UPI00245817E8|nr:hypothetical protein [Hyphomicrobium sp. D-2]MDH4983266.1 hypothetical protein [Hyphomicrobium sp. D-2]